LPVLIRLFESHWRTCLVRLRDLLCRPGGTGATGAGATLGPSRAGAAVDADSKSSLPLMPALWQTSPTAGLAWPVTADPDGAGFIVLTPGHPLLDGLVLDGPPAVADQKSAAVAGGAGRGPDALCRLADDRQRAGLAFALERLEQARRPFQLEVAAANSGRRLTVTGRCHEAWSHAVNGENTRGPGPDGQTPAWVVVWLTEAPAGGRGEAGSRAGRQALSILQRLPIPVWTRGADLGIAWCNRAYDDAVEWGADAETGGRRAGGANAGDPRAPAGDNAGKPELLPPDANGGGRGLAAQAMASGQPAVALHRVTVAGARRTLAVTELPPAAGDALGGCVGFAVDRTDTVEAHAELERHIAAHSEVLEQLGSAIAIYGADGRLLFHNHAYTRLWGLNDSWLAGRPGFAEILDELHSRRRLPEHANYPLYKREQLALFTTLLEAREDLIFLSDGSTLRQLVVPHPFGGLLFVLEDVSDTLALESSLSTLIAVQRETLDHLAEGVAVFGGDGRLKLSNPAYASLWGLRREEPRGEPIDGEPHITDLIDRVRPLFDHGSGWEDFRDEMIGFVLERTRRGGRLQRTDGGALEFNTVPLPDGAVLLTLIDVSDSVRVEQALRAANAALDAAESLKAGLVSHLSYHVRIPLTTIRGYTELLALGTWGALPPRQRTALAAVLTAADDLLTLIEEILELTALETGHFTPERRPIRMTALLARALEAVRPAAEERQVRVLVSAPPTPAPMRDGVIEGDERRLAEALAALIGATLRFPPADRVIRVETSWRFAHVLAAPQPANAGGPARPPPLVGVTIAIHFGPAPALATDWRAIQAECRDAGGPAAPLISGVGLGLRLVKRLLERQEGDLALTSDTDGGLTLACRLPARTRDRVARAGAAGS